jgi:hypothetical protein
VSGFPPRGSVVGERVMVVHLRRRRRRIGVLKLVLSVLLSIAVAAEVVAAGSALVDVARDVAGALAVSRR